MKRLTKALLVGAFVVVGVAVVDQAQPAAADTCTVGGVCESDIGMGFTCDVAVVCSNVDTDTATDGWGLNGQCTIARGDADAYGVTFVVHGQAEAAGGAALATGITCRVYAGGVYWGGASGGAPGPVAVTAGTSSRIPYSYLASGPKVCAYANTLYYPNDHRRTNPSYGCPAW